MICWVREKKPANEVSNNGSSYFKPLIWQLVTGEDKDHFYDAFVAEMPVSPVPLWVFVCGCCADEWGCVLATVQGKKKKRALRELVGQVRLLSNLWRNGMNASDCWPIVEQSHVSLFKVTLCILCANVSKFFVHEHMSTWKHFSPAQNTHRTHVHRSVDVFPQNSGHASTVWQLHPKGRTNVFTRELFYCERRPYNTDCS